MRRFSTSELLVLCFAGAILAGSLLLYMPFSLRQGRWDYLDALFTATSAICVTGLAVKDTGTFFTPAGQVILLALVQLGGLGILTMGVFLLQQMGWAIASRSRDVIYESYTPRTTVSFRELLRATVRLTLVVESAGAVCLFVGFYARSGDPLSAAWHGVFHSVSAFCNAGFSLFPDSFISYNGNLLINVTLMLLITLGGIGFFTQRDLQTTLFPGQKRSRRPFFKRLSVQTRIVLLFSAVLVFMGAGFFFLLERRGVLAGMPAWKGGLCSLFQSVTARTAGLNTVDIYQLSSPTLFLLILLMFIGASPGGTGGGIKVTTLATLMIVLYNRLLGRRQAQFYHRALSMEVIQKTVTLFILSVCFVSVCLVLLLLFELGGVPQFESRGKFLELLFEAVSAFGTVGLSTGLTPTLCPGSKIVLIALMFAGRLGPLTLASALEKKARAPGYQLPEEAIMIG
jgi:trk system potassium uptake protein